MKIRNIFKLRRTINSSDFMKNLQHQSLPKLEHKTHWVKISEEEYWSMKETLEIISDTELMEHLRKSMEDIKAGRTVPLEEILKD